MRALNYSRQREAIYQFLMEQKNHPTADMIYEGVKKTFPHISLGTVYRNLLLLEETGRIQKIPGNDAKEHYDADISEHPHFICRHCHKVVDLKMDNLEFLHTLASQSFDGDIEKSQLVFFGCCGHCKGKN